MFFSKIFDLPEIFPANNKYFNRYALSHKLDRYFLIRKLSHILKTRNLILTAEYLTGIYYPQAGVKNVGATATRNNRSFL